MTEVIFKVREDLLTPEDSPVVTPRNAEPGPGILAFVEIDGTWAIAGGSLDFTAQSSPSWGDLGFYTNAITRSAGILQLINFNLSTWEECGFGFHSAEAVVDPDSMKYAIQANTADGRLDNHNGLQLITGLSISTDYKLFNILRGTGAVQGYYDGTNWIVLWVDPDDSTATLYNAFSVLDGAGSLGKLYVSQLPAPWDTDNGIALAADDFNRGDGALGNADVGGAWVFDSGIWTVASNKAVGTPVAGSELVTNGNFSAWTGDDPDGWTVLESLPDNDVSQVGAGEGYGGSGTGLCNLRRTSGGTSINQAILTVGGWYIVTIDIDTRVGGSISVHDIASGMGGSYSSTGSKLFTGKAKNVLFRVDANTNSSNITVDNVSVKQLTLTELFSSLDSSINEVLVDVDITVVDNTQAGVVTNLDSAGTPANFLIAYHDKTNIVLLKNVAGNYTDLIDTPVAYSAGATLRVIAYKSGSDLKVRLYYDDALIGTEQTISDAGIVDNTIHGLFSTYSGNTLDNFLVTPRILSGAAKDALDAVANAPHLIAQVKSMFRFVFNRIFGRIN